MILHEMQIHRQIPFHPFIVKLISTFQDENMVYMMQEFVQGGELFSVIQQYAQMNDKDKTFAGMPEYQAKFYTLCISDAIAHMHRNMIIYRDLKPENCMIDIYGYPMVIDFGYAKYVPDNTYTFCGTPRFLPPEAINPDKNGYNYSVDHWSLGVLIYEMLTGGINPFYSNGMSELELFTMIEEDEYPKLPTDMISSAAANILDGLLTKNPFNRLGSSENNTQDILQHVWFSDMDINELRKRNIRSPWIPPTKDTLDTSCFDDWDYLEDKVKKKYPKLSRTQQKLFQSIPY